MKIVIDTKEDVHILNHIIRMLHAISATGGSKHYDAGFTSTDSLFDSPSSSPVPETPTGMFNMFDSGSGSSPSSSSTTPFSLFDAANPEKKEEDKTRDFMDSLQVY